MADITSRPDLPWLQAAVGLGSVWDVTVARVLPERRLAELAFDGGTLLAPAGDLSAGMRVRVRIPAREVILASDVPKGLSLHNALPAVVSALDPDGAVEHAVVQLRIGGAHLLAEVTRDAVARLGLRAGQPMRALIKSVSLELHGGGGPRAVQ